MVGNEGSSRARTSTMPNEVLIFDKEIHNFNDEVGRLYRTERVILKLDKDINNSKTNQMNRQKCYLSVPSFSEASFFFMLC